MRVDLRGAVRAERPRARARALWWSAGLAVLLVLVAGAAGASDFSGPRWVPRFGVHLTPKTHAVRPRAALRGPRTDRTHFPVWIPWLIGGLLASAVIVWVVRWLLGRRAVITRPSVPGAGSTPVPVAPEPEPEVDPPAVRSGLQQALQTLGEQRDPADAVVRAWLGLQESAEESGIVRGAAETPSEFTTRIIGRAVSDDRAVRTLLRLYLRTRFGDHPVTADDVAEVRDALHELVAAWPSVAAHTGPGPSVFAR